MCAFISASEQTQSRDTLLHKLSLLYIKLIEDIHTWNASGSILQVTFHHSRTHYNYTPYPLLLLFLQCQQCREKGEGYIASPELLTHGNWCRLLLGRLLCCLPGLPLKEDTSQLGVHHLVLGCRFPLQKGVVSNIAKLLICY